MPDRETDKLKTRSERSAYIRGMQRVHRTTVAPMRALLGVDREVAEAWQEGLLAALTVAADCKSLFDHPGNHATFIRRICAVENPHKSTPPPTPEEGA